MHAIRPEAAGKALDVEETVGHQNQLVGNKFTVFCRFSRNLTSIEQGNRQWRIRVQLPFQNVLEQRRDQRFMAKASAFVQTAIEA